MKKIIFILAIICFTNVSFGQLTRPGENNKFILGNVETIQSAILNETRVVNICLPEGYSPDSSATYPVIYLLDGGADEDFIHISGLVRYYTTPWIARFPNSIVVGIENVNRRRDFTFAVPNLNFLSKAGFDKSLFKDHGGSEKFISFIEKELQPFIQTHYKANEGKTIIGESLGGLLASEVLLKKPSLFDTYIIISPSLWWGEESLITEPTTLSKNIFPGKLNIYVGASNKAEDTLMYNDAFELSLKLKKISNKNIKVSFDYLPNETHATISHQAVYNAFKLLYPKTK
ncbi:MAG: alpha/beta hydrolase-fold protein [Ferruginibacter sp.]